MRRILAAVMGLAFAFPAWAQDEEKPPDEAPPDSESKLADEEKEALKLVEKAARERADLLRTRMAAAKQDSERGQAINDVINREPRVIHPIIVNAVMPYLNPRQQSATLKYGDSTIDAALEALKKLPFDETYYGVKKHIDANKEDVSYVQKLLTVFGEIRRPIAIPYLVKFLEDKRDGKEPLCREAAVQLGKIGHRDAISPLIREIEAQDKAGPNDKKMHSRRNNHRQAVLDALKAITGQEFKSGAEYRAWWDKNMDTFQKEPK